MTPLLDKPIIQMVEKPISQQPQNIIWPKTTSKVSVPDSSQLQDKFILVPDYVIPQTRYDDDSNSIRIKRKTMQDISREILAYADPIYRSPPNQLKYPSRKFLENS